MELIESGKQTAILFSSKELQLLTKAITTALDYIEDWEFHTLIGGDRREVQDLRSEICKFLKQHPESLNKP